MAVGVGAGHIAPAGGGFEPQRVFNWTLLIPGLDDSELIRLSAERVQLPKISTAVMHVRYMNEDVKVSGGASVEANSITCRDWVDRKTLATLNKWMEQVHNPADGKIGYASDYKRQITIQLVDSKGEIKRSVTGKGVWPSSLSFSDLEMGTDQGQVKISMTLQVDRYTMNLD